MSCYKLPTEVTRAIDRVVTEVLEQAGIGGSPVDAVCVAKSLDMEVAWDDGLHGRARIVRLHQPRSAPRRSAILLKPEPRRERRQWAVAHEIGEAVAFRIFEHLETSPGDVGDTAREQIANLFASRLLLPSECYLAKAEACDWDLVELKREFSTASHEIVARRMLDFEPPVIVTIFDQDEIHFRGTNSWTFAPPLMPMERACQRDIHSSGQARCASNEHLTVQGWPVREDSWRREILRLQPRDAEGDFAL